MTSRPLYIYSPRAKFVALAAFLFTVFLLGGGSRADIQSLVVLRPGSALFLAYALAGMSLDDLRDIRTPFFLLVALAAVMLLQLVPLPPSLWSALPAREGIVAMGSALNMEDVWRPLTLSPSKTWNSLFSLLVPATALALFAIQDDSGRRGVWPLFLALAATSAIVGMLQLLGGGRGPLYFYAITNPTHPVGLFANRNHHAVFLATMILTAAWWFASAQPRRSQARAKATAAIAAIVLFVPVIFLTGSRAGLICTGLAVLGALYLMAHAPLVPTRARIVPKIAISRNIVLGGLAVLFAVLTALVIVSSRAPALDRLLENDPFEDLRLQILPILLQMANDFLVFGAGFGTLEYVYKVYEPVDLLSPRYLNNAHNDWIQFVIEGGLLSIFILAAFMLFGVASVVQAWLTPEGEGRRRRLMAGAIVTLFGIGSVVDYPLRTPSLMALFAIACAALMLRTVTAAQVRS